MERYSSMRISKSVHITSLDDLVGVFDRACAELLASRPAITPSTQLIIDIKTAFVEAVANAARHAGELKKRGVIKAELFRDDKHVGFYVFDCGHGFRIEHVPLPDLTRLKASGRGIFIMKQLGDVVEYKRLKGVNKLIFKRSLVGQGGSQRELDLLYELSEAIVRQAGLDDVYNIILDRAMEIFKVDRASILIYDEAIKALKVVASRGLSDKLRNQVRVQLGDGVSGYVFQHGQALLIEDVGANKRGIEKKDHYKTRSFMSAPMICSPLKTGEKPVGVINLTDRASGKKFTKADLKLLSTIANQAMACLYIRDLVQANKGTEIIRQEMAQLRQIQSSYLPSRAPQLKGYDIAGHCEMAQSVGGDYFDYFVKGHFLYIVIADVSGHNILSAMTMVNFRAQLKVHLENSEDCAVILTRLNATLFDDLSSLEQFVSCVLIRIDADSGEFALANAGHYPPLVSQGLPVSPPDGAVLGVVKGEVYAEQRGELPRGERLLLFTDGVVEAMNENGKMFGLDQLRQRFLTGVASSHGVVTSLCHEVQSYRSAAMPIDDITLVMVARN